MRLLTIHALEAFTLAFPLDAVVMIDMTAHEVNRGQCKLFLALAALF